MKKQFYLVSILVVLLGLAGQVLLAQKPAKPTKPAGATTKRPVVHSSIGTATGSPVLPVETARALVSLPLKVSDEKNIAYVISSYQFAYKRIGIKEDEETGKTTAQSDIAADRFTITPLPPVWQKNIVEGLHQGEELYFFDIIVFDKQGRRFFAPELKITIQ